MTLPSPSYGSSTGRWDVEDLLETLADAASDYSEKLERFTADLEFLRDAEAVERYAHAEAHKLVSERAFEILMGEMRDAVAETQEYNLSVFTNHMESAMLSHMTELVKIVPLDPGKIDVQIEQNMPLLGMPEQWIAAVVAARGELGLGNITNAKVRSKIWKEIYQIDREGGVKIHPTSDEDVTERYVGKYFATIAERLKNIDPESAPWWYYINYGNAPVVAEEGGATPYPLIEPTYFVRTAEASIEFAFYDLYKSIQEEAERVYTKYLQDDYNIEGVTDTFRKVEEAALDISYDDLLRGVGEAETHEAVTTVRYNNAWYDVIKTSGGNTGLRYNLQRN